MKFSSPKIPQAISSFFLTVNLLCGAQLRRFDKALTLQVLILLRVVFFGCPGKTEV